jgi:hypothetical protein
MKNSFARWIGTVLVLAFAGCAHPKEAELVASVEAPSTIVHFLTVDTARLPGVGPGDESGEKALAALLESYLATVGQPRGRVAAHDHLDVIADLPAPGYALRARISPKSELLCAVALEPLKDNQPLTAAPWSVHDALSELRRSVSALSPPRRPAMTRANFVRLTHEAAQAERAHRDPPMTPEEYVRVPRSISNEGADAPYHVPPVIGTELKAAP